MQGQSATEGLTAQRRTPREVRRAHNQKNAAAAASGRPCTLWRGCQRSPAPVRQLTEKTPARQLTEMSISAQWLASCKTPGSASWKKLLCCKTGVSTATHVAEVWPSCLHLALDWPQCTGRAWRCCRRLTLTQPRALCCCRCSPVCLAGCLLRRVGSSCCSVLQHRGNTTFSTLGNGCKTRDAALCAGSHLAQPARILLLPHTQQAQSPHQAHNTRTGNTAGTSKPRPRLYTDGTSKQGAST